MDNINNNTGDRYKDLIQNIKSELKLLNKKDLKTIILRDLWGKSFQELDTMLDQLIEARVVIDKTTEEGVVEYDYLLGRKFECKGFSTIYQIRDLNNEKTTIVWDGGKAVYGTYMVSRYIKSGNWILLEE